MHEQIEGQAQPPSRGGRRNWIPAGRVRLGAVVAIAALVGLVVWVIIDSRGSSTPSASSTPALSVTTPAVDRTGPIAVSPQALVAMSKSFGQPIYWIGPKRGDTYELTRTTNGNTYVRYLPRGVDVGDPRAEFTIVVTYPFPGAFAALKRVAEGKEIEVAGGGIAVVQEGYEKSVHIAFPKVPYQMEIFDPSPARSLQIATSGDLQPVG